MSNINLNDYVTDETNIVEFYFVNKIIDDKTIDAVSYTHLTLPTTPYV